MSIHEMYSNDATFGQVLALAEKNCAECTGKGCKNIKCPNMRALMDQSERKIMTTDEKKRYFDLMK